MIFFIVTSILLSFCVVISFVWLHCIVWNKDLYNIVRTWEDVEIWSKREKNRITRAPTAFESKIFIHKWVWDMQNYLIGSNFARLVGYNIEWYLKQSVCKRALQHQPFAQANYYVKIIISKTIHLCEKLLTAYLFAFSIATKQG